MEEGVHDLLQHITVRQHWLCFGSHQMALLSRGQVPRYSDMSQSLSFIPRTSGKCLALLYLVVWTQPKGVTNADNSRNFRKAIYRPEDSHIKPSPFTSSHRSISLHSYRLKWKFKIRKYTQSGNLIGFFKQVYESFLRRQ